MMKAILLILASLGILSPVTASALDTLTISAVGDIMMGSTYPREKLPANDGKSIFDAVKASFQGSDIVFGNLEGPLTDNGSTSKCSTKAGNCYAFRTPRRYVAHLKEAGFTVLSVANNHAMDFGLEGAASTRDTLLSARIRPVGGDSVALLSIKGRKIAVVGFSFFSHSFSYPVSDIPRAIRIVSSLKKTNDLVIVSFHGGAEGHAALHVTGSEEYFLGEKRGNVQKFARSLIEAGADVVIGHGPHVLRAMEVYKGRLIAYSLGNFLTYGMFNIKGNCGLSIILKARISLKDGTLVGGEIIPLKLTNGGIPQIDPKGEAIRLLERFNSGDLGRLSVVMTGTGMFKQRDGLSVQDLQPIKTSVVLNSRVDSQLRWPTF